MIATLLSALFAASALLAVTVIVDSWRRHGAAKGRCNGALQWGCCEKESTIRSLKARQRLFLVQTVGPFVPAAALHSGAARALLQRPWERGRRAGQAQKKACTRQAQVEVRGIGERGRGSAPQWFWEPRWAQPVVRFSTQLNSSYITMAMAPTTSRPANARPICMDEPAEISR